MGKLETEARKRTRKRNLRKIILGTVAMAGILSIGAIVPNALVAMAKLGLLPRKQDDSLLKRTYRRLVHQGFLRYRGKFLHVTPKGDRLLHHLDPTEKNRAVPKHWDGKWRVLIFDIPEKRRSLRYQIRTSLISIGFVRLQDSVWVYPYDCEDFIALLKADLKIGKSVLYMIVESLEYDTHLKKHFKLES